MSDLTLTAEPTMIDANKVRFDCKLHCQAQTWQVSSRRDATFIYSNEELVNITDKIESMSIREIVDYFARAANVSVVEAPLRAFQMNFTAIQCRFNEEDLAMRLRKKLTLSSRSLASMLLLTQIY